METNADVEADTDVDANADVEGKMTTDPPTSTEPRLGRPLVDCTVCRMPKAPRGRDPGAASANRYCAHECPGHWCDPQPDYLWPGEEDFAC